MKELKFSIQKQYHNLRPSEKKVADYFLHNEVASVHLSLTYLEQTIKVSQPTIIRFVKQMGYPSFQQFKIHYIEMNGKEVHTKKEVLDGFSLEKKSGLSDIVANVVATTMHMLEDMLKSVDTKVLDKVIQAISKANRIIIFSVENSNSVAIDLATKLAYLGFQVIRHDDYYMQRLCANNCCDDDVVIGISYSGESKQTLSLMQIAKRNKAVSIALTSKDHTQIKKEATYTLLSSNKQQLYGDAIYSRCAQTALVDCLYMGIISSDYDYYTKRLETSQTIMIKAGLEKEKV